MVFRETNQIESIAVSPMDGLNETHYINLIKSGSEPTFYVTCCCDEDWGYEFYLENNSDYERVKFNIMNAVFECETMDDLLNMLSDTFEDGFADIMVEECDHCNCDCDCNENKDYKYLS